MSTSELRTLNFRIPLETISHMDELRMLSGQNRTQFVVSCIESAYDSMKGNPKLASLLEQMQSIREQLENF